MEYQVPQFIEVEDKIVGPLTLKQFLYLAGGVGICAVIIFYLPLIYAVLLCIPFAGLAGALTFYTVNGKPFIEVMESAFGFYTSSKLFLWKHEDKKAVAQPAVSSAPVSTKPVAGQRLTRSKLSELAWSLDIKREQGVGP